MPTYTGVAPRNVADGGAGTTSVTTFNHKVPLPQGGQLVSAGVNMHEADVGPAWGVLMLGDSMFGPVEVLDYGKIQSNESMVLNQTYVGNMAVLQWFGRLGLRTDVANYLYPFFVFNSAQDVGGLMSAEARGFNFYVTWRVENAP